MDQERACAILNINRKLSRITVLSRYREEALEWHPDKNPGRETEVEGRMKLINAAKAYLLKKCNVVKK